MAAATSPAALPARVAFKGSALKTTARSRAAAPASRRAKHVTKAAIADPPTADATDLVPSTTGTGRKTVVVLGSGWGAISFVKSLQVGDARARHPVDDVTTILASTRPVYTAVERAACIFSTVNKEPARSEAPRPEGCPGFVKRVYSRAFVIKL